MRILIIDDDLDMQQIVSAALEVGGYDTVVAPDPVKGLEILSIAEIDAIVLDVMMPRLSGYELLEILRKDPRTRHLPVLMLSARGSTKERIHGIRLGADDYLPKPFDPEELLVRLERLVNPNVAPPGGLIGNIAKRGLTEALQNLEQERWTGAVRLTTQQRHGLLEVKDGNVVAASFGLLEGAEAIYAMLVLQEGTFTLDPTTPPEVSPQEAEDQIHLPSLALKLAWLQDELKKYQDSLPSPDKSLFVARRLSHRASSPERIPYTEIYNRVATLPGLTLEELEAHEFAPAVKVKLAVATLVKHGVLRPDEA